MTETEKQKLAKYLKEQKNIIICSAKSNHYIEEVHRGLFNLLLELDPQTEDVRLNGAEIEPAILHAELSTVPMFNTTRLIWLRHGENLLRKIAQNKTILAYFVRDLPNLPQTNYFLLHLDEQKLIKDLEFLQEGFLWFREPELKEDEIADFLLQRSRQMGFETDMASMQLVCDKSNANLRLALTTLDQLFAYCLDSRKISVDAVKEACFDLEGDFIFQISNHIIERNIHKALHSLEKHSLKEPMILFGFWTKIFQEAVRFALFTQAGFSSAQIQSQMNLNYRALQNTQKILQHYHPRELDRILQRLIALDQKIKENSNIEFQKNLLSIFIAQLKFF